VTSAVFVLDTSVLVNFDDEHDLDGVLLALKPTIDGKAVVTIPKVMAELNSKWKHIYRLLKPLKVCVNKRTEMSPDVIKLAGELVVRSRLMKRPFLPGDPADPWVVAVCKVHGWTAVTDEKGGGVSKIPGVCKREGVTCLDRHEFAQALRITLPARTKPRTVAPRKPAASAG
jgi:hypothetical protein